MADGVVEYVNKYFTVPKIKYNGPMNLQKPDNIDDKSIVIGYILCWYSSLQCDKKIPNDRYTIYFSFWNKYNNNNHFSVWQTDSNQPHDHPYYIQL